ncbi:MAG: hypothetical protein NTX36_10930 [Proteobacteria bacterium]|nr:hypothetical protein [Pseudomonadota bacterium]
MNIRIKSVPAMEVKGAKGVGTKEVATKVTIPDEIVGRKNS